MTTEPDPAVPDHVRYPFLETDEAFEGVGAHRDNPNFDIETAKAEWDAHVAAMNEAPHAEG